MPSLDRETTKMRLRAHGTLLMQSVASQRQIAERMWRQAAWDEAAAGVMFERAEELDDLDEIERLAGPGVVTVRESA